MSLAGRFFNYIEIRTKITSVYAFLFSLGLLLYQNQPVRWGATAVFFASMFLFDLTTTAINNYVDTKTNDQILAFSRPAALAVIYVLFAFSAGLGIALACMTDAVVLLTGMLCFACGVLYTWGPVPISRQPLGEALSGVFYGVLIPFLMLYINSAPGKYLTLGLSWQTVTLSLRVLPLLGLLLFCVAPTCVTANIMLANNTCDVEKDVLVKRHTLPYYLGRRRSLFLFAALYAAVYFSTVLLVAFRVLPPLYLLSLLSAVPVRRNVRVFFQKQVKEETFVTAVKNFVWIMSVNSLVLFLCALVY